MIRRQSNDSAMLNIKAGIAAWGFAAFGVLSGNLHAGEAIAKVDFARDIQPIFAKHCVSCHGKEKHKGGYRLDQRVDAFKGGDSGEAPIIAGSSGISPLITFVSGMDKDMCMPPKGTRLASAEVALLRTWVDQGATWPVSAGAAANDSAQDHWAFRPVSPTPLPTMLKNTAWPRETLDYFVLARLEAAGLNAPPPVDRRTLIRRLSFDLTGLPPTPGEIELFVSDGRVDAEERLVNRLLDSRHFGERWGRHWLDLARYSDTVGGGANFTMNDAWRYRDYVIEAFNSDKPYDRFLTEQIAGDLLPSTTLAQRLELLTATAFLVIGPKDFTDTDKVKLVADSIDEQLDTVGRVFMGLSLGCARCHSHKFDPVTMEDYYALVGVFGSTQSLRDQDNNAHFSSNPDWMRVPLPTLTTQEQERLCSQRKDEINGIKARREALEKRVAELESVQTNPATEGDISTPTKKLELDAAKRNLRDVSETLARIQLSDRLFGAVPMVIASQEAANPQNARLNLRGNPHDLGREVKRGAIRAIGAACNAIPQGESGRLQIARWLTSPQHPLTARVVVNRVWQHLMGEGLVASPDDFGKRGAPPTHPELLDHLTSGFIADGWSVKRLIRRMILSSTYRRAHRVDPEAQQIDPDNALLWKREPARLDAESLRDALLALSGRLDRRMGGPSLVHEGRFGLQPSDLCSVDRPDVWLRRAVYLPIYRGVSMDETAMLAMFDSPDPNLSTGRRTKSLVSPQALFMLNDELVLDCTKALAVGIIATERADTARVRRTCLTVLARAPTPDELHRAMAFLASVRGDLAREGREGAQLEVDAWASYVQTLFCSGDFLFVD